MEVTIRPYDPRDAADLADVFFRSVRQVALSDYTAAQVRAWAPEPRTAEWAHGEASDGRLVLVAANEDDRAVAYIDLEPNGHIDRVFCAPEAAGQGIASQLYDAVEAAALAQRIRSLFTEASELARRLFERKGFVVVERQDMVVRGVAIHNYRMVKILGLSDRRGQATVVAHGTRGGHAQTRVRAPGVHDLGMSDEVTLYPVREDDLPMLEELTQDPERAGEFEWFGWSDLRRWRRGWDENGLISPDGGTLIVTCGDQRLGLVNWRRQLRTDPAV